MIAIDASIAIDWYIEPENALSRAAFYEVVVTGAIVPGNFACEVLQALLRAMRAGKMLENEVVANVTDLEAFEFELATPALANAARLATRHALSAYDAGYLAVATSRGVRLATRDAKLAAAAKAEGCLWIPPPPDEVEKKFSLLLAG